MPRGTPKEKDPTPPNFLRIRFRPEDFDALQALADENYRTPELQAAFMVANLLATTKRDHVAGIIAKARAAKEPPKPENED